MTEWRRYCWCTGDSDGSTIYSHYHSLLPVSNQEHCSCGNCMPVNNYISKLFGFISFCSMWMVRRRIRMFKSPYIAVLLFSCQLISGVKHPGVALYDEYLFVVFWLMLVSRLAVSHAAPLSQSIPFWKSKKSKKIRWIFTHKKLVEYRDTGIRINALLILVTNTEVIYSEGNVCYSLHSMVISFVQAFIFCTNLVWQVETKKFRQERGVGVTNFIYLVADAHASINWLMIIDWLRNIQNFFIFHHHHQPFTLHPPISTTRHDLLLRNVICNKK